MKNRIAASVLIGSGLCVSSSAQQNVTQVRDVENPARNPFVVTGSLSFKPGEFTAKRDFEGVPAGKRAVIEFISMTCSTEPPDTIRLVEFFFRSESLNGFPHYFLPISKQGDLGDFVSQSWVAAQLVQIYADEGPISILVGRSKPDTSPTPSGCEVTISGHTIPVDD